MHRAALAIVLAAASLVLAIGFGILTAVCAGMEQGSSADFTTGTTTEFGPRCVGQFHPFTILWGIFAVAGGAGLWAGKAWPAIALGAVGLALGVLSGFSAGFFGIGCGALLLAAGLVGRHQLRRTPLNPPGIR